MSSDLSTLGCTRTIRLFLKIVTPKVDIQFSGFRPIADGHILNYLVSCLLNSQGLLLHILVLTSIKI